MTQSIFNLEAYGEAVSRIHSNRCKRAYWLELIILGKKVTGYLSLA